jgi:hypothetical protein
MRSAIRIVAALAAAITFLTAAGSASARVVQSFGTAGADRLRFPDRIVYGPDGLLHVVDFGDAVRDPVFVRLYTPEGARAGGFRIAASEEFPPTIAVDAAGDTYVSQVGAVLKYSRAGALLARLPLPAQADGGPAEAIDLGVDPAGRLVVFDGDADRVDTYAPDGRLVARFDVASAAPAPAGQPSTSVGESGLVYVGDAAGISVLDSTGALVRRLPRPAAVPAVATYVDGPDGSVYAIAGHRIQKIGPDGAYRGAVATDRSAVEPRAAVARDGSIYATSWHTVASDGVILKLAPITAVDLIPPTISVRSFSSPPLPRRAPPHARLVLGRMVLAVSEDAAYRVVLRRRATTRNRRHPDFGRYMHIATVDVAHVTAGAHRLVLDARAFSYIGKVPPPGRYRLTFVATDDSGNESRPARITFTVTRSRRG